ncbi:MAG: asparagine synthase-related protein [Halobacteriota archaeon]
MKKEEVCSRLRELLSDAVERNAAEALLLSGGLDTSILAAVSKEACKNKKALTVFMNGTPAPDLEYAKRVAQKFLYKHHLLRITENEALERIPEVIKAVRSFDPALPNDLAIYVALKEAKNLGIGSVMTGDGADELFAGYYYMHELSHDALNKYVRNISKTMYFSSNKLGAFLGVEIKQPYLDKEIVELALDINQGLKVKEIEGRKYGKWILRKTYEKELGEIAWREKEPIEVGSGTTKLRAIIASKISDAEFDAKKREYEMEFMNKEHLFFYEIYKEVVGEVPKPKGKENVCPLCKAELPENRFHCYICGFSYPIDRYIEKNHIIRSSKEDASTCL